METKKVTVNTYATMNVEVLFSFDIEVEVPNNLEGEDIEDFVKQQPEYQQAWDKEVQHIHKVLKDGELEYKERGGEEEMSVED